MQGVQVRFLAGELKSHMAQDTVKKLKKSAYHLPRFHWLELNLMDSPTCREGQRDNPPMCLRRKGNWFAEALYAVDFFKKIKFGPYNTLTHTHTNTSTKHMKKIEIIFTV